MKRLLANGTALGSGLVAFCLMVGMASMTRADPSFSMYRFDRSALAGQESDVPSLAIDARTTPPVVYATSGSGLARSSDGGDTFGPARRPAGRGEITGVAVDKSGSVYVTLRTDAGISVARSADGVPSFSSPRVLATDCCLANPSVVARDAGHVVVFSVDAARATSMIWVSRDSAATFQGPFRFPVRTTVLGRPVIGPFGSLHAAYIERREATGTRYRIGYAGSADGGETWSAQPVTELPGGARALASAPVVAIDDAGLLYMVWSAYADGDAVRILFTSSGDHGATWSEPSVVSELEDAWFPSIVARSTGRVNISAIARHRDVRRKLLPGTWDLVVLQSLDAALARPAWSRHYAARDQAFTPPCGPGCSSERTALTQPYAMIADGLGNAMLSYASRKEGGASGATLARQVSGWRIL